MEVADPKAAGVGVRPVLLTPVGLRPPSVSKTVLRNLELFLFFYGLTSLTNEQMHPIKIKNVSNYENISEKILQKLILEDIESFMKELGDAFCFIGSEYKIKIGDRNNYIDLLLFNIKYNCYVVVELKVTELKKEHIGQIRLYMNYIDKKIKTIYQDKTIGIIICKKDNKFVMEYCSDKRIFRTIHKINS